MLEDRRNRGRALGPPPIAPVLYIQGDNLIHRTISAHAWLFDLDGVLTPTAAVHMRAWAQLFIPYLETAGAEPFTDNDYFAYIDGKPRYDGVRSLLGSRGIVLPDGSPKDSPEAETICGLGNRKNAVFNDTLALDGVAPYASSIKFLDAIESAGHVAAVVSSSKNARRVLEASGLAHRFSVVVDGSYAAKEHLAGKPAPDTYIRAAELLGVPASSCAVIEDAESGVQAGAAGTFAIVIGVDRGVGRQALHRHGAVIVVDELDELIPSITGKDKA